jgi:alcohol dehydrogenase class IV
MPVVTESMNLCKEAELPCALFSDIKSNPTAANVEAGVAVIRQGEHDGVIAIGGGSALDAAKAISLLAGQTRPLWDFEDVGDNWKRANEQAMLPVIAIPTTAGTGSEVGRASVITDEEKQAKRLIFHPAMMPKKVILDPALSVGLPPHLTAATGMDALSHALEAYCSPSFHPMAEAIALEAIRLIKQYFPRAYQNGADREARMHMLVASSMGATAFQKGLGAMHALAHPLGALYDSHHGLLNAILMPYVVRANAQVLELKILRLSHYLGLEDTSVDGFISWILALRKQLEIPHALAAIGIDEGCLSIIGELAYNDAAAAGNPVALSPEQYREICADAIRGKL